MWQTVWSTHSHEGSEKGQFTQARGTGWRNSGGEGCDTPGMLMAWPDFMGFKTKSHGKDN